MPNKPCCVDRKRLLASEIDRPISAHAVVDWPPNTTTRSCPADLGHVGRRRILAIAGLLDEHAHLLADDEGVVASGQRWC